MRRLLKAAPERPSRKLSYFFEGALSAAANYFFMRAERFADHHRGRTDGTAEEMSLASGTHLGPYEILCALGAGDMGEVTRRATRS